MTVAKTETLSELHSALADVMVDALDAEKKRISVTSDLLETDFTDLDEETAKHVSNAISLAPSARVDNALLKTISAFLKDNNITSDLDNADGDDEVQSKLKELQGKRRVAATPLDGLH